MVDEAEKRGLCLFSLLIKVIVGGKVMHDRLIKLFTRDKDLEYNNKDRYKIGNAAAIVGIISNFFLFVVKYLVGVMTFSISVRTDSFNNLFDSVSSLIALIGFKISSRPADDEHPYGHARFEIISDMFVGLVILIVGLGFAKTSVETIISGSDVSMSPIAIVLLVGTLFVKVWQASFNRYLGKKIDSQLLITTAQDSINDCLINILVLIGLGVQTLFNIQVDGVIGLFLSAYIVFSGIQAVLDTIKELMGKRVSDEELKMMKDVLSSHDDILGYHDLVVHSYGSSKLYATLDVEIDAKFDLLKAHDIADRIQNEFKDEINVELVVHIDPVLLDDPLQKSYYKKVKTLIKEYNNDFSIHDFRLIRHRSDNIIEFDIVVKDCEKVSDKQIIEILESIILTEYPEDSLRVTIDRNYLELK